MSLVFTGCPKIMALCQTKLSLVKKNDLHSSYVESTNSLRSLKLSSNYPIKYLDGGPFRNSRYCKVPVTVRKKSVIPREVSTLCSGYTATL